MEADAFFTGIDSLLEEFINVYYEKYMIDIEIEIQGNVLSIVGTRRVKSCAAGVSYHQMEITYSRFEKILKFPSSIEGASIEHNFDNGLLIINLWKADEAKP